MKKILVGIALVAIIIAIFFSIGGDKKVDIVKENTIYQNTIAISRSYIALRVKTNKILTEASNYSDYNSWNKDMSELLINWKNVEAKASSLEKEAKKLEEGKLSLGLINVAQAYTKDEISNVFDKAPAGKKIKTLAKFLGVDAKRAFKILKNDQEFVRADAWNEAGDTFKKLEASAVVIKDGCKVAGYVGAAVMTGGVAATASVGSAAAGAGAAILSGSATVAEATVMIVTGTDLVLELGEDAATIGLGDNHKVTKVFSDFRSYTDPAASILSLTDIPKNVSKGAHLLDKVGVALMEIDQIRSMLQDGKFLGINITPNSKIEGAVLAKNEVDKWIKDNSKDSQETKKKKQDVERKEKNKIEKEEAKKVEESKVEADVELDESAEEDIISDYDDIDDWLEGFEDLDDWMDELEEELVVEEELAEEEIISKEDEKTDDNMVDKYTKEMRGQAMNEYATLIKYAQKFEEMKNQELITDEDYDELMEIAKKISEEKKRENQSVEDQESSLLEENERRRSAPWEGEKTPSTFEELDAHAKKFEEVNKERRAWLKAECERIYGEGEKAEMCYIRGE